VIDLEVAEMYGTVAKMRVKPGMEQALTAVSEQERTEIEGLVGQCVYRMESEPNVYYLAVMFRDKETYEANAASPEQHERYLAYRELLMDEPEWHDGEIVYGYGPPAV
jgi:quinol monooxygenase YgiN